MLLALLFILFFMIVGLLAFSCLIFYLIHKKPDKEVTQEEINRI